MNITIIGCGGVGSVIARLLIGQQPLTLIDGDTYEPPNSYRQPYARIFAEGINKAEAHAERLSALGQVSHKPIMITSYRDIPADTELIIATVDNNEARMIARQASLEYGTPLITGANETHEADALLFIPEWAGTPLDPHVTWPALGEPSPVVDHGCTTRPEDTQTPIANLAAASGVITLALQLIDEGGVDYYSRIRIQHTQTKTTSKQPCQLIDKEAWNHIKSPWHLKAQ